MTKQRLTFVVLITYLWVMMILLGSIVLETFMIYPNIFHDPPQSLALALEFMAVSAPSDFFPPLGFLSWVTGAGSVLLAWPVKPARFWILASVLMIILDGLLSIAFFWPRNTILFVEGSAVHSADVLIQTAREFEMLHWARLALAAAAAAFIFVGFLKYYRNSILAAESGI
jgi:hypothetical protein